jgi:peroxiredoxin
MLRNLVVIVVCCAPAAPALAGTKAPAPASPAAQKAFKALLAEYNRGVADIRREMLKKMPEREVNEKLWSEGPFEKLASFGPRFLALARQNPRTEVGWGCVRWIVYIRGFSKTDKSAALAQMLRDHLDDDEFYSDLFFHLYRPGVDAETLYREVLKRQNAPRRVAGLAFYSLGVCLKDRGGENETGEARKLFEKVVAQYAQLPHPYDSKKGTLGDAAAHQLFEIDRLQLGKVAPDISGKDFEGESFRLSDYRGKVVLLIFCGDWCGHCHKLYPLERRWTEELRERPFAIVGVNSDPPAKLRAAIQREKFSFRWFADGGTAGPINTEWNVSAWPTIYVLDPRGRIRMKKSGVGNPQHIKECLDKVLSETDRSPKAPS